MKTEKIDYRLLLKKYLVLIGEEEGIDFLFHKPKPRDHPADFRQDEWDEMKRLSKETDEEWEPYPK